MLRFVSVHFLASLYFLFICSVRIYQQGFRRVRFSNRWYIVPRHLAMRSCLLQCIIRRLCCRLPGASLRLCSTCHRTVSLACAFAPRRESCFWTAGCQQSLTCAASSPAATAGFCGRLLAPSACVSRRGSSKGSHAKTRLRHVVSRSGLSHSEHDFGAVLDGAGITDCALLVCAWSAIVQLGRSRKQVNPFLASPLKQVSRGP